MNTKHAEIIVDEE